MLVVLNVVLASIIIRVGSSELGFRYICALVYGFHSWLSENIAENYSIETFLALIYIFIWFPQPKD